MLLPDCCLTQSGSHVNKGRKMETCEAWLAGTHGGSSCKCETSHTRHSF
jgi:hypothetical protein